MKTEILRVSAENPDSRLIAQAAAVLRSGELVGFPTETVYGLAADALNEKAVERVFRAKGRPADNPLIVHVSSLAQCSSFAREIPAKGRTLAENFWPGPLTLVVPRSKDVPDKVTAGLDSVALRVPSHEVALAMIRSFGNGVVAPSANLSGRPSPTTAEHVFHDLGGRIHMILDGGPTRIGLESTVVDVTLDPPVVLRPGGLSLEKIRELIGEIGSTADPKLLKRSPGTRYRHYAPNAKLVVIPAGDEAELASVVRTLQKKKQTIAFVIHSIRKPRDLHIQHWNVLEGEPAAFAKSFFSMIRKLDEADVDVIVVEGFEEHGLGAAIMDRLRKASL